MGQPRGLAAAVGDVAVAVDGRGDGVLAPPADALLARVLGVLGLVSAGFISLHLVLQPLRPPAARPSPRGRDLNLPLQDRDDHPSAAALHGLRRLLGGLRVRDRGAPFGTDGCRWARWSRPWTRSPGSSSPPASRSARDGPTTSSAGGLVVLGSGRERLLHALAARHRADPLARRHREARRLPNWTVLLAIGAFSLSLLGTFLVRSGVITSVHAFATDPRRGLYILALLVIVIGFSLLLYARCVRTSSWAAAASAWCRARPPCSPNNVLLTVASASVLLGTLYRSSLDALGLGKISVGPPLLLRGGVRAADDPGRGADGVRPLPALEGRRAPRRGAPRGARLRRQRGDRCRRRGRWITSPGAPRSASLAAWVVLASLQLARPPPRRARRASAGSRLRSITASWWKCGLPTSASASSSSASPRVGSLDRHLDVKMKEASAELAGYTFVFRGAVDADGPNYDAARGRIELLRDGRSLDMLTPEARLSAQGMPMTEASLDIGVFRDRIRPARRTARGRRLDRQPGLYKPSSAGSGQVAC